MKNFSKESEFLVEKRFKNNVSQKFLESEDTVSHNLASNIAAKLLFAWQVLFAMALLCVSLFSISVSANDMELRMERFLELQVQRQKERALERAEFASQQNVLANVESNIESATERQLQSATSLHLEMAIENQMAVKAEQQASRANRAVDFAVTRSATSEDTATGVVEFQIERLRRLHGNPNIEISVEDITWQDAIDRSTIIVDSSEPDTDDLGLDDLDLGAFDSIGDAVTDTGASTVEDSVDDAVTDTVEDSITEPSLPDVELPAIDQIPAIFSMEDLQTEQAENHIAINAEQTARIEGNNVWTNEWIIMADAEAKSLLEGEGYQFSNEEHLESFDSIIASVRAPASYDLFDDYEVLMKKFNKHDAVIDMNHVYTNIYTNATNQSDNTIAGLIPGQLLSLSGKGIKIGMVDTAIDTNHALLKTANIKQKHFTQDGNAPAFEHGTAVASVLVGESDNYEGIMSEAELVNASVFFESDQTQSITTAMSLLRGLNWLVKQDIQVINMSLAGPPNKLLQRGIEKLCDKGVVIVAAAGNNGPLSSPMYPAGYGCAVAVTAVDAERQLYKKAVRGEHIDIAAYGVDVMAAEPENQISAQSGTSIAAPFVSAWLASNLAQKQQDNQWLENAFAQCEDLGERGVDPLYGHGLLPIGTVHVAQLHQVLPSEFILKR